MKVTKEHVDHALNMLGVLGPFIRMNQCATSFEQLSKAFDEFKKIVKQRYLAKAKRLHPDKVNGDQEKMKDLNAAYDLFKKLKIERPRPQPRVVIVHNFGSSFDTATNTSTTYTSTWPPTRSY